MKLYELTENYRNLQELLENPDIPTEMIETALNEVGEQFEDKAENVAKLIKTLEANVLGYKAEEKRLADRRKSEENRITWLKSYLESSMRLIGKIKFKGKLFSFNIQKNTPSLNIENEKLIPKEYWIEQAPILDKKAILSALKEGAEILGANIHQTESLRIR